MILTSRPASSLRSSALIFRSMTFARPSSNGVAMCSSTMICAARSTRSSSPSARMTRLFRATGAREHRLHGVPRAVDELVEVLTVASRSSDRPARDAAFRSSPCDRGGDHGDQARVERLGNEIIAAEAQIFALVGVGDRFRHFGAREFRDGVGRGDFHLLVDRGRAAIERAAEDERETKHVVDLVGIVRASRADDRVGAGGDGVLGPDFGIGIGHREDQGIAGHGLDHLAGEDAGRRQAEKDVRAGDRFGQRAGGGLVGVTRLVLLEPPRSARVDDAGAVDDQDLFRIESEPHREVDAGDRGGACARADEPHVRRCLSRPASGR